MNHSDFCLTVVLSASKHTGGGFHQALTNLEMILRNRPPGFTLTVVDARRSFSQELAKLREQGLLDGVDVSSLPKRLKSLRDRVVTDDSIPFRILRMFLSIAGHTVKTSVLARFLDNSSADLVYFTSPAPEAAELSRKPYVWTLWDLCHLDSPEFPEVRTWGKFEAREDFNSRALRKASSVVVDSDELVDKAVLYFGVSKRKFVTIPFSPPSSRGRGFIAIDFLPKEILDIQGKYFFYPAQLWTHKNHLRIVEALHALNSSGYDFHAVFVGKDHGAGASIRRGVAELGMESHVHFLGYVEDEAIPALYANSLALVMASYFGPTNIPPLEAMMLGTPVIASDVHQNQLASGALYFNPDDSTELSQRMLEVIDSATSRTLIKNGHKRIIEIDRLRDVGEKALVSQLSALSKRIMSP